MVTCLTPHCLAYPFFVDTFVVGSIAFEGLTVKCRRAFQRPMSILKRGMGWDTHGEEDWVTEKPDGWICIIHCFSLPEEPWEVAGTKFEL